MKFSAIALALASTAFAQSNLPTLQQLLNSTAQLSQLSSLAAPYLNNLTSAAAASGQNITVLAPNNNAVGAFLNSTLGTQALTNQPLVAALLSYHVLIGNLTNVPNTTFVPTFLAPGPYANVANGQRVEVIPSSGNISTISGLLQNSSVNGSAMQFQGGTLYPISTFLTLPQNITTSLVSLNLTSAVGAFQNLSLTQNLASRGDLTYFVPNNAAFQRLGGNLANLSSTQLTQILEYHVVAAGTPLYSTLIMNGSSVPTLQGSNLTVRFEGTDVYVNNAKVLTPNVLVSNGVVHVIDRLLNPSNSTVVPNTSTTQEAFSGATSATNVPFTSGVPTPTSVAATKSAPNAQGSAASSSSKAGAWQPVATGAMNMGALFGGAALVMNL